MTLPAPLSALDAWDAMLPTAQRLAERLDGPVLDEERNALGRQRIAHIRDPPCAWDRDHDGEEIIIGRRATRQHRQSSAQAQERCGHMPQRSPVAL
jgi:cell division protein ZipA